MKPPKPSITEVFHHYGGTVTGADRGGWQKATCALLEHDDKSPSASLNESECRWHCWTCDKGGDAIDLVKENEGLVGYAEAAKRTQELFGAGDGGRSERSDSAGGGLFPRAPRNNLRGGIRRAPWMSL